MNLGTSDDIEQNTVEKKIYSPPHSCNENNTKMCILYVHLDVSGVVNIIIIMDTRSSKGM